MPKIPASGAQKRPAGRAGPLKHDPLARQIARDLHVEPKQRKARPEAAARPDDEQIVDANTSKRLLKMAREQQQEVERELGVAPRAAPAEGDDGVGFRRPVRPSALDDSENSDASESDEYEEWIPDAGTAHDFYGDNLGIDERDAALLDAFLGAGSTGDDAPVRNLADLVARRLADAEDGDGAAAPAGPEELNPKLVEVYTRVGILLSRYKSGKLPKTFKIVPALRNWEEILHLTRPEEWTPNAMFMATRLFGSNLKPRAAQRFYQYVLLDAIRHDIQTNNCLNYHHYMSLKRAMYKPTAFFKGILLPLCEAGDCTLREAALVASVLVKVSIPMLHSAAALLKLAELPYTGPNSLFIRVLLDKKYALPFKVVDSLVFHFVRFEHDQRRLPVLWHQSLLVFVQRYKEDLVPDQKDALRQLTKRQFHPEISPEVRRELDNSVCRGEVAPVAMDF